MFFILFILSLVYFRVNFSQHLVWRIERLFIFKLDDLWLTDRKTDPICLVHYGLKDTC